jgi:hypothetical protein
MKRLLRFVFLLLIVAAVLGTASYTGARATAGKLLGPNPPVFDRNMIFVYRPSADLPAKPPLWMIRYGRTRLPGLRTVTIYVSVTGNLLATLPKDLDARLDAYQQAQQP